MLYPPPDCRVSDRQASLGHHLDQVAVRGLIAQVPAHAQNDDLLLKVSGLKQVVLIRIVTLAGQSSSFHPSRSFATEPPRLVRTASDPKQSFTN